MDPQDYPKNVAALVKKGLMTRDAVLNTLTERMEDYVALSQGEQSQLRKAFDSLCINENSTRKITQSAFVSFLQTAGFLPLNMTEAGALVYRSLLYLSQAPFYESTAESLTLDGLLRAVASTESERSSKAYHEDSDTRSRTPADTRRLLFQSLATTRDGKGLPFDTDHARKEAERRAFDFSGVLNDESARVFAQTNYDEDGDEMFHDLLDTLVNAQHTPIGWGGVPRDGFRQFAKELRGGRGELLRHLSIPQDEFQAVVKIFLVAHVGRPIAQIEQSADLDHISRCVVRSFAQGSNLGITWEMFEQARNGVLFMGLRRLLSPLYKPLDEIDIKDCPSKSGHIATRPILSQLGMILSGTVTFDNIQLHKYYNITESTTSINAAILAEQIAATQIAAVPDPVILLISGKLTQTGERAVFGYHLTWFNSGDPDPCLLFQLSPVHDVFRGDNAGRPGWKIDSDENLVFGERSNGVALALEKDCKRAMVSHHVSGKGMYNATAWRGDWQADVQVEKIEMWIEL